MAATGELALLPMISPMRVHVVAPLRTLARRPRAFQQPHVYRLPPREKTGRLAYGPSGHAVMQKSKGRIIDLYT